MALPRGPSQPNLDKVRAEVVALLGELGTTKIATVEADPFYVAVDLYELKAILLELQALRATMDIPHQPPQDDAFDFSDDAFDPPPKRGPR